MGFTQGVSGLRAAASDLDHIGNNIANSQTNGYKAGSAQFADLYANARSGLGVTVAGTAQDFSTGALSTTGRNLDVAIDGKGFFRMAQDGNTQFSRDGQFQQTKDGFLSNAGGALLTGYNAVDLNNPNAASRVATGGQPEVIQIPQEGLNARATGQAGRSLSLDAGTPINNTGEFNARDAASYDWSTSSTLYDSLGNSHSLDLYFTKTGENQWQVNGQVPMGEEANLVTSLGQDIDAPAGRLDLGAFADANGNVPGSAANGVYQFNQNGQSYTARVSGATDVDGNGQFTGGRVSYTQNLAPTALGFDASGNLERVQALNPDGTVNPDIAPSTRLASFSVNPQNGAAPIGFDFDFSGSTQTAQSFAAGNPTQDGYAAGALSGISVGDDGMITGRYDNGQSVNLAQIAVAGFRNENGLQPVSGNAWVQTADSGAPTLGTAGTGQFGDLRGGTLESSNVDLSRELVDMIVSQRSYQANAESIKTQDQILQTTVNLR